MKLAKDKNASMCGFKVRSLKKSSSSSQKVASKTLAQAPKKKRRRKTAKPAMANVSSSRYTESNYDIVDWQLSPSSVVQDMNFDLDFHNPHSAANLFMNNDCGSSTSSSRSRQSCGSAFVCVYVR